MVSGIEEAPRRAAALLWSFVTVLVTSCAGQVGPAQEQDTDPPDASGAPSPGTDPDAEPPPDTTDLPCDVFEALTTCRSCHGSTPRFGAPMSLVGHGDFHAPTPSDPTRPVYRTARARIHDPHSPMPPASAGSLSDTELATLTAWLDAGAPAGSCDVGAPPPDAGGDPSDDLPCEPTHVLRAHAPGSTDPYPVPENADNLYTCFAFRPEWGRDTQAIAWAPLIGDDRVVHHWILYEAPIPRPDGSIFPCTGMPLDAQFVMGWAPGGGARVMPDDVGFELPDPGKTLILQVHYNNAARHADALDDTGVAICTTETPRAQTAGIVWLGTLGIAIPPRARDWPAVGHCPGLISAVLPSPLTVLSAFPHMHTYGTSIRTDILRVSGGRETLLEVDPWDFNDQHEHILEEPLQIQKGDTLQTTCRYDNTSDLPVFFGEGTDDEMCFNFVTVYPTSSLPPERRCWL